MFRFTSELVHLLDGARVDHNTYQSSSDGKVFDFFLETMTLSCSSCVISRPLTVLCLVVFVLCAGARAVPTPKVMRGFESE